MSRRSAGQTQKRQPPTKETGSHELTRTLKERTTTRHSQIATIAAIGVLGTTLPTTSAADSKPNVLFLAVDDMNDWIGRLETTPRALTPNIDRLANRGVTFTNAHTAGVFCAPSRAVIFSGQYASTTFAAPEGKVNSRKDLVVEGETFRREKGKGNSTPLPKYRPYTSGDVSAPEK